MKLFGFINSSKPQNVEEVNFEKMNHDEFMVKYFLPKIPLIIKDGAKNWPLFDKWNKDYIIRSFGNYKCTIVSDSRPAFSKVQDTLKNYFQDHKGKSTLTLEKFISKNKSPFLKDIIVPNTLFKEEDIARYFFYHSVKNAGTLPHTHGDAFNILQAGKKELIFYNANRQAAPRGFKELQECHKKYPPGAQASEWFNTELPKLPKKVEKVYRCIQEPGDI